MESVLDYIIANYVWFLVGFVIITMMIIGYVADTTDFWHKKKPKKDKSNSEYVEDNDESSKIQEALDKLKDKKISDAISPDINEVNNDLNATLVSEVTDVKTVVSDDLNVPFGDPIINNNDSNVNSISEDLNAPFGDTAIKNNNSFDDSNEIINKVKDITPNQEDLNKIIGEENVDVKLSDNGLSPLTNNYSDDNNFSSNNNDVLNDINSNNEPSDLFDIPTISTLPIDSNDDDNLDEQNLSSVNNDINTNLNVDSNLNLEYSDHKQSDWNNIDNLNLANEASNKVVDYDDKIVPEYITDKIGDTNKNKTDINLDDDIWKF